MLSPQILSLLGERFGNVFILPLQIALVPKPRHGPIAIAAMEQWHRQQRRERARKEKAARNKAARQAAQWQCARLVVFGCNVEKNWTEGEEERGEGRRGEKGQSGLRPRWNAPFQLPTSELTAA